MKFVKIKEDGRLKCEAALQKFNVTVLWEFAHEVGESQNRRVPIQCNSCGFSTTRSVSDLKRGKYFCFGCHSENTSKKLKESNYELLNLTSKVIECRCIICKAGRTVGVSAIYNSKLYCQTCADLNYQKKASEKNFNLVAKIDSRFEIECKCCGTAKTISMSPLMEGEFSCAPCSKKKKRSQLNPKDYTVLSHQNGVVLLSCNTCGYWKRSDFSSTKDESLACLNCRKIRYESALKERDCELLSKDGNTIYFRTSSGEVRSATQSSVLSGRFATSDDNHWNNETSVYVIICIHEGELYCKVGTSNNPDRRMKDLKLSAEASCIILTTFPTRHLADAAEKWTHKHLSAYRVEPEKIKEFSHRKLSRRNNIDGVTEWFSVEALRKIRGILDGFNRYSDTTD